MYWGTAQLYFVLIIFMGKTKDIQSRYKILNDLLRSGSITLKELHAQVNSHLENLYGIAASVSLRTVQTDIENFRNNGAPIEYVNKTYKYTEPGYDYFKRALSSFETEQILQAAQIIKQLKCFEHHEELINIYNKLENRVALSGEFDDVLVQFDKKTNVAGTQYLSDLIDALKHKNVISFLYKPFVSAVAHEVIMHPYLLKEYNSRWYIIGRDGFADKVYNYALDRICSNIKLSNRKFIPPHKSFYSSYHQNIIGVTIPDKAVIENIELCFDINRAPYIQTAPLHETQKEVSRTTSHVVFSYNLIINRELISTILSFGNDVKVLVPASLKNTITQIATKMNS